MQILAIDDNNTGLKLLSRTLEAAGHRVTTAVNGKEGLDEMRSRRPDLVICDILMPHLDGYQLCHHVRADSTLENVPIILYTCTYLNEEDEQTAYEMGATKYLRKPMHTQELLSSLSEAMMLRPRRPNENMALSSYSRSLKYKLDEHTAALERSLELSQSLRHRLNSLQDTLRLETANCNEIIHLLDQEVGHPARLLNVFARLILRDASEPQIRSYGDMIANGSLRIQSFTENLMVYLELADGRATFRAETFSLTECLEALERPSSSVSYPPPRFHITHGAADERVETDKRYLTLLLRIVCDQLSQFVPAGEIEVHLSAEESSVQLILSDNGAPLPNATMKSLFATSRDPASDRGQPRTTLATALTQALISHLSGSLECQWTADGCSLVVIRLPKTSIRDRVGMPAVATISHAH